MALAPCRQCGRWIEADAAVCPYCRTFRPVVAKKRRPARVPLPISLKGWWPFAIFAAAAVLIWLWRLNGFAG